MRSPSSSPGARAERRRHRPALTTELFTDIVDSTARAVAMGDRAWRSLLESHDETAAHAVEHHQGTALRAVGVPPVAADHPTVPPRQHVERDPEKRPTSPRQHPVEHGQPGSVLRLEPRTGTLTTKDVALVAKPKSRSPWTPETQAEHDQFNHAAERELDERPATTLSKRNNRWGAVGITTGLDCEAVGQGLHRVLAPHRLRVGRGALSGSTRTNQGRASPPRCL
jgi:hypothetical protein